jgi:hypothetical protein
MTAQTIVGRIHGRSIVFDGDLGLDEGQLVEVSFHVVDTPCGCGTGGGQKCSADDSADDPLWGAILEEVHRARKLEHADWLQET